MTDGLASTAFPFRRRGTGGQVTVRYGVNEDPIRWGYPVLQLAWAHPELVRGFPVIEATVEHPAEGYGADMGWLQVVRYESRDLGEEERATIFDVPPQLAEIEMPYAAFGVRPTFFDAPSTDARDVDFDADTFLVYTPDAVMTRVLRPICAFTWVFRVREGGVLLHPLSAAGASEWERNLAGLRERFPSWTFEEESF